MIMADYISHILQSHHIHLRHTLFFFSFNACGLTCMLLIFFWTRTCGNSTVSPTCKAEVAALRALLSDKRLTRYLLQSRYGGQCVPGSNMRYELDTSTVATTAAMTEIQGHT